MGSLANSQQNLAQYVRISANSARSCRHQAKKSLQPEISRTHHRNGVDDSTTSRERTNARMFHIGAIRAFAWGDSNGIRRLVLSDVLQEDGPLDESLIRSMLGHDSTGICSLEARQNITIMTGLTPGPLVDAPTISSLDPDRHAISCELSRRTDEISSVFTHDSVIVYSDLGSLAMDYDTILKCHVLRKILPTLQVGSGTHERCITLVVPILASLRLSESECVINNRNRH